MQKYDCPCCKNFSTHDPSTWGKHDMEWSRKKFLETPFVPGSGIDLASILNGQDEYQSSSTQFESQSLQRQQSRGAKIGYR